MLPPQRLVVVGMYHVGFAFEWIGLWIVFGHANLTLILSVLAVALGVHLFVLFYEEPTLCGKFGADYEEYCRNVRRWRPASSRGNRRRTEKTRRIATASTVLQKITMKK